MGVGWLPRQPSSVVRAHHIMSLVLRYGFREGMCLVVRALTPVAVLLIMSAMIFALASAIILIVIIALLVMMQIAWTMLSLVTRNIFAVVPIVLNKIDGFAAGVVFVAVFPPVFCITGRYVQIDGRAIRVAAFHYFGLAINHLWLRVAPDLDAAIKSGLAETERDSYICGQSGCGRSAQE